MSTKSRQDQGQTQEPEICSPFLALASLRKFAPGIEAIDEGEEVGRIKEQASEIEPKPPHRILGEFALDENDFLLGDPVHVVPESLTGELRSFGGNQPREHSLLVPGSDLGLAPGSDTAVEGRKQYVLSHRQALVFSLGDVAVNDGSDSQLFGNLKAGCRCPKLAEADALGSDRGGTLQSLDELIGWAQVLLPDDLGLAIHPLAFAQVVVGAALDDFLGETGH